MTRFDKWISGQSRARIICDLYDSCEECPLCEFCKNILRMPAEDIDEFYERWAKACEAYLDEEVGDEESP